MSDKEIDVLFIEDNLGDAKLIQLMLMEAAPNLVSLTHTQTLQQGFEMMQQVEYDVVLLDLSLPTWQLWS
jgi:CheY-like chemotaxis protein